MTDELRDLFAQAVLDEPDRIVSPDEDIARGRAKRTRRRRRRLVAGVVALGVAGSLGLVVPDAFDDLRTPGVEAAAPSYDELPPYDPGSGLRLRSQDGSADSPAGLTGVPERAEVYTEAHAASDDGVEPAGMVPAIRAALPDDVRLTDDGAAPEGRRHLVAHAERDGTPFTLRVWWQPGSSGPWTFRPCEDPVAAFSRTAVWDDCTQAPEDSGTLRVLGTPDPQHRVLAIDGPVAAITVVWETHDWQAEGPEDVLSDDEAEHIVDSAWDVAWESAVRNTGNLADLRSDFGMGYVAQSWANVEAALTSVVGPVRRVRKDEHEPGDLDHFPDMLSRSPQAVTASYRTADGMTVDLAIWDAGTIYGGLCTNLIACDVWPGSREYFRPLLISPADAMGGTALGNQGQVYLVLRGVSGDGPVLHTELLHAIFSVLPDPS